VISAPIAQFTPNAVIEADKMNPANFSMAQFKARADAFIEVLLERKGYQSLSVPLAR
jgi:hypothetical protein